MAEVDHIGYLVTNPRVVETDGGVFELRVDDVLAPTVERLLHGSTKVDRAVDALVPPRGAYWLRAAIAVLRWYRTRVGWRLGHRCVFEPSCSRYAELALRRHGAGRGLLLALRRLWRCRPGNGGLDLPSGACLEEERCAT